MTIDKIRTLLGQGEKELTCDIVDEANKFFSRDSEGETEYVEEFIGFYFCVSNSEFADTVDKWHLCNQKYIANISGKPELKKKHLPYLYLKEVEYYTTINSYSQCIRCVNKILDLEDVPDFCMGAALSQAVDIFMTCGLTKEAERYVEAMRVFSNLCDLPDQSLIMLDCNLMQAFAFMGKRKEYEFHRRSILKYDTSSLREDIISLAKLYVLGSEAIIDFEREPSTEYIHQVNELMEDGCFTTVLTADYAEVVVPIFKWVKGYISDDKIIEYMLYMIKVSDTLADRLDMYEVLIEEFKPDREKYGFVMQDYSQTLIEYYKNSRETHRHEVAGEMLSYEIEKQYRKKALTDELTGIGNRSAYEADLDEVKGEMVAGKVPPNFTVFALDVNGLKAVNDNFGHNAGDDYIKGAAECMQRAIGNYGHIYRVGGDEFNAIVRVKSFPAENVVKILRDYLSNWTDSYGNTLSMAIGYASAFEHPELALDEITHLADVEMYKDKSLYYKQTGKDRRKR